MLSGFLLAALAAAVLLQGPPAPAIAQTNTWNFVAIGGGVPPCCNANESTITWQTVTTPTLQGGAIRAIVQGSNHNLCPGGQETIDFHYTMPQNITSIPIGGTATISVDAHPVTYSSPCNGAITANSYINVDGSLATPQPSALFPSGTYDVTHFDPNAAGGVTSSTLPPGACPTGTYCYSPVNPSAGSTTTIQATVHFIQPNPAIASPVYTVMTVEFDTGGDYYVIPYLYAFGITPTVTPTGTPTFTATATASSTATSTATPSSSPTRTPTLTAAALPSATATSTATAVPAVIGGRNFSVSTQRNPIGVVLTWAGGTLQTSYLLARLPAANSALQITNLPPTQTSFIDTNVSPGVQYCYLLVVFIGSDIRVSDELCAVPGFSPLPIADAGAVSDSSGRGQAILQEILRP